MENEQIILSQNERKKVFISTMIRCISQGKSAKCAYRKEIFLMDGTMYLRSQASISSRMVLSITLRHYINIMSDFMVFSSGKMDILGFDCLTQRRTIFLWLSHKPIKMGIQTFGKSTERRNYSYS